MSGALPIPPQGEGYASLAYARSLAFAGAPLLVPEWATPVLLRAIPHAVGAVDAMGPYPVCCLHPAADIAAGLRTLRDAGAVSVVLVADPLSGPAPEQLARQFPFCTPFKTHYVIDRQAGPALPSKHHADRIRRGERRAAARVVPLADRAWQQTWCRLYAELSAKRRITGLQAFSPDSFRGLAALPAATLVAFAAEGADGAILGMQLWIRNCDRAYSHLTATSEAGLRAGATFVLYAAAIRHFEDVRWLDFGGGAGHADDPDDSLAQFKRGFSNATVNARLCGAVLNPAVYERLTTDPASAYFPAYRAPKPIADRAQAAPKQWHIIGEEISASSSL